MTNDPRNTEGQSWADEPPGFDETEAWEQAGDPLGNLGNFEIEQTPEPEDVPDPLATIRDAERIQVWRTKPTWCRGMVCSVEIGPGEEIDLQQLKTDWGGGEFLLRPMEHTPKGWRYRSGSVTVRFTGEPRERGMPLGADGAPRVIDTTARPTSPPASAALVRAGVAPDHVPTILGLFERVVERLERLEQRVGQAENPRQQADPLGEVRRAAEMVRELRGLAGVFAGEAPEPDDDDDDDDDDEDQADETPTPEAMLLKLLEKKFIDDDNKPTGQQTQEQPSQGPRLIKSPSRPVKPRAPQQPTSAAQAAATATAAEPEPDPEPAPEPEPVTVLRPEADPWAQTVPPEMRPSPEAASQIAEHLKTLPTEQALELLDQTVRKLPKEQVIAWIQAMQQSR